MFLDAAKTVAQKRRRPARSFIEKLKKGACGE